MVTDIYFLDRRSELLQNLNLRGGTLWISVDYQTGERKANSVKYKLMIFWSWNYFGIDLIWYTHDGAAYALGLFMVNHNNIRHGSEVIRCDERIKNAVLIYITVQATPQHRQSAIKSRFLNCIWVSNSYSLILHFHHNTCFNITAII